MVDAIFNQAVGPVLALVGLGYAVQALIRNRRLARMGSWPSARGRVIASHVESGEQCHADIAYEFDVGGTRRGNTPLASGKHTLSPADAHLIVETHPAGMMVDVYYDPADPQKSFIVRDGDGGAWESVRLSLFFIVVGGALHLVQN